MHTAVRTERTERYTRIHRIRAAAVHSTAVAKKPRTANALGRGVATSARLAQASIRGRRVATKRVVLDRQVHAVLSTADLRQ